MRTAYILDPAELQPILVALREQLTMEMEKSRAHLVERPIKQEQAAEFLNVSRKHFGSLVNRGIIPEYRFDDNGSPYYFPSEIVSALKSKSRKSK